MQPTYLPWLGYFSLIASADMFVFLDTVQFEKRSWQQRNRIKGPNGPLWLTVPVLSKGRYEQRIDEVEIDPDARFAEKHAASLTNAYGKAPQFQVWASRLFPVLRAGHRRLADLDVALVEAVCAGLDISTPVLRSSALAATGRRDELLAAICVELGATRYLSAAGSAGYLMPGNALERAGIDVAFSDFRHPVYPQRHGDFLSHLSVVDALFMAGDETASLIRDGSLFMPAPA